MKVSDVKVLTNVHQIKANFCNLPVYFVGPVVIGFEEISISVSENIGNVVIPVTLVQMIAVPVIVDYAVVNGTAREGEG